jgi:hypothetical protein
MHKAVQKKMFQNWNEGGQTHMQMLARSHFATLKVHIERRALALLKTPITLQLQVHQVLVLRPSCIPEKK